VTHASSHPSLPPAKPEQVRCDIATSSGHITHARRTFEPLFSTQVVQFLLARNYHLTALELLVESSQLGHADEVSNHTGIRAVGLQQWSSITPVLHTCRHRFLTCSASSATKTGSHQRRLPAMHTATVSIAQDLQFLLVFSTAGIANACIQFHQLLCLHCLDNVFIPVMPMPSSGCTSSVEGAGAEAAAGRVGALLTAVPQYKRSYEGPGAKDCISCWGQQFDSGGVGVMLMIYR
jgi:hypothetical protein